MSMPRAGSTSLALSLMGALAVAQPQQPPAQPSKPTPPAAPAAPTQPAAAAPDNKVVTTDALHVLVLPMKGSYLQHPAAFERLGSFLAGRGVSPDGPPIARYFSDPSVGEADLVWEVGFPVPATLKADAPFEVKDIPGSLTAVHIHHGSLEELGTVWPAFVQWVLSNGYRAAGAPMQIFHGTFGSSSQVEMRMPVEK
jgi:effector-binding domain-containing protein